MGAARIWTAIVPESRGCGPATRGTRPEQRAIEGEEYHTVKSGFFLRHTPSPSAPLEFVKLPSWSPR